MSHIRDMKASGESKSRDRSATEAAIVAAGERVLRRSGWSELNVQAIAAEAAVDRKLVYRYFGGAEGVAERLAERMHLWLGETLAAAPPSGARTYRAFARETLLGYLDALRREPLLVRLIAWELTEATPLTRRMSAARAEVLQAWTRSRRPGLPMPVSDDPAALNAVMLAAVQQIALAAHLHGRVAGFEMNELGWTRVRHAIERLVQAYPE